MGSGYKMAEGHAHLNGNVNSEILQLIQLAINNGACQRNNAKFAV